MSGAQQLIGSAFVLGYITYFMELINVSHFFTVSVVLYVIMLLSNISAFFVIEYVGRRKLLVYGIIGLTLTELVSVYACPWWLRPCANALTAYGNHGLC